MYEAMTIVHCSGLQYTPGLTMVHQTTPMLEVLVRGWCRGLCVRTGWRWWVGTRRLLHCSTSRGAASNTPSTVRPLPHSRTALAWPGLGWISHIFPGLHKTFNFFLLQKNVPRPQATIIMVQCCSCASNSGTGTLAMRNEGAYRRKHYSDQP